MAGQSLRACGLDSEIFRAGFRQNGFFADFYFWAAGFFRGFCRWIFSPHFCGKKCPEKSSRKIPGKILQNLNNKNPPTHFCRLPRAKISKVGGVFRGGESSILGVVCTPVATINFAFFCAGVPCFNTVHTRCIVKTSGFTRGVCKNRGFY